MLARKNYIFLGLQAFATVGLLSGCIITNETTTSTSGPGGSAASTTTTATSTTGGEGGAGVGGGTTGAGGATACVGETGHGVVADCDNLNITPVSHGGAAASKCGPNFNEEPPGYGLCTNGFTIFNAGAATTLVECLALIGVQDECKTEPLQACIDKVYDDECEITSIKDDCQGFKAACGADPFDAAQCASDLNPFSDTGTKLLSECINATDVSVSCQKAYDDCYTQVFTF